MTSTQRMVVRNHRHQAMVITSPGNSLGGRITYRYGGVVCITGRQRIWIAATSRMRHRDRVDAMLEELRQAKGRFKTMSAAHAESSE